jgi:exosortase
MSLVRSRLLLSLSIAALGASVLWASWPTLGALMQRWSSDPQYSHGYVVPVLALLVLWHRRAQFPTILQQPSWWGIALLLLAGGLRLGSAFFLFNWLDAVSLLPALAGSCLLLGGWPLLRWAWPAVAFLIFMVPLPFQAEISLAQPLQSLATTASTFALQTLGFPAVADGNMILIDDTRLGVSEACSGLSMLMTFFALSTAVALVIRRPLLDRILIIFSAIPIGVLVNIARITVTGILYRTVGLEIGKVVFHDLAGWLMMPLALGLLSLELQLLSRLFVTVTVKREGPVALRHRPLSESTLSRTRPPQPLAP